MLRITINETPTEKRWILQGQLVGPWVAELRTSWKETHRDHGGRTCIVDLNAVSFINKGGERLLRAMSKQGAELVAGGMYIKHVLEQLQVNKRRGSFKWILCLFAGSLASVIACSLFMHVNPELGKMNAKQGFRAQLTSNNGSNTGKSDFTDGPGGTLCPHS